MYAFHDVDWLQLENGVAAAGVYNQVVLETGVATSLQQKTDDGSLLASLRWGGEELMQGDDGVTVKVQSFHEAWLQLENGVVALGTDGAPSLASLQWAMAGGDQGTVAAGSLS